MYCCALMAHVVMTPVSNAGGLGQIYHLGFCYGKSHAYSTDNIKTTEQELWTGETPKYHP